jgi:hypothetical protein
VNEEGGFWAFLFRLAVSSLKRNRVESQWIDAGG